MPNKIHKCRQRGSVSDYVDKKWKLRFCRHNGSYQLNRTSSLEIDIIFDLKMMAKSGLEFLF